MIKGLRDYQAKAIRDVYKWLAQNKGNPCIVAPTGSGKAWICAGICEDFLSKHPHIKILVLSHVKELLVQDAEKITQVWPSAPVGLYSAGLGSKDINTITVAGIQSIWKKGKELGRIHLVIVDEAHLISNTESGMYRTLLADLQEAYSGMRVIGLTATPYRLGQGMLTEGDEAIFTALLEAASIEELIQRGYLAKLTSTFTDMKLDVEGVRKVQGDYEKQELEARVNNLDNNTRIVEETIRRAGNRKAWLIFCVSVSHAEAMRDEFIAHGINAATITGKTSSAERERIFTEYKAGKIRALTNVGVATTGFDYPDIDVIVMARPTLSPGLYMQMSGRGMRVKSPGHYKDCLVLDFAGNIERHGAITKIIPPRRTVKRGKNERPENFGEMFKECPQCHKVIMKRARICAHCGYQFSELSELNTTQDIMGSADIQQTAETPPEQSGIMRMKVHKWFWKVCYSKKDSIAMLRVDFYGEDLMQGPKQLFLKLLHAEPDHTKAYRNLKSLLQGVMIPPANEIYGARVLYRLAETINANYNPPSWIEYRQSGKYTYITNWGWDE
ncbi:MAG: DEAD/DEAH box helicase family protein [Synergistaceae bacterium]|nr:DEAD/DEAH box helicase family protein [Synergistaceae bacterium]